MQKETMRTIEVVTYGEHQWDGPEHAARIERARVLYSGNDTVDEVLKFCYLKNGRHARTHLTISQENFADLFLDAVEKNVFEPKLLREMYKALKKKKE